MADYKTHDTYPHLLGLIGLPLAHSFSEGYFNKKFELENLDDFVYGTFPIGSIHYLNILKRDNPNLLGLNVTIPYKEAVLDYLDHLDDTAVKIGAVNTIRIKNGKMVGYNTDAIGFQLSLNEFKTTKNLSIKGALVLGSGGASKAIAYALKKENIPYKIVSRSKDNGDIVYADIDENWLAQYNLIVNTTPLGTNPKPEFAPEIPYELLNPNNALFDLVYNPEKTLFLSRGEEKGCAVMNGLKMLHAQAEAAWEIWTK